MSLSLFNNIKTMRLKYKINNKNKVVTKISANFLSNETKINKTKIQIRLIVENKKQNRKVLF